MPNFSTLYLPYVLMLWRYKRWLMLRFRGMVNSGGATEVPEYLDLHLGALLYLLDFL